MGNEKDIDSRLCDKFDIFEIQAVVYVFELQNLKKCVLVLNVN